MSEAMKQIELLNRLEDIKTMCADRKGCFSCPFCRYELESLIKEGYKPVRELCSLFDTFKTIPSAIPTGWLKALIEEGRK